MPKIGAKHVNPQELAEIIKDAFPNSDLTSAPVAILERWFCTAQESPDFFDYLSKLSGEIYNWDRGRVFNKTSEIRWEREGQSFHVVWIVDDDNIPDEWDNESLYFLCTREVLLWGEKMECDNRWYEKQVPRIFKYPVNCSGGRVYAVLNEYKFKDVDNSSTVYRFKEVIAV